MRDRITLSPDDAGRVICMAKALPPAQNLADEPGLMLALHRLRFPAADIALLAPYVAAKARELRAALGLDDPREAVAGLFFFLAMASATFFFCFVSPEEAEAHAALAAAPREAYGPFAWLIGTSNVFIFTFGAWMIGADMRKWLRCEATEARSDAERSPIHKFVADCIEAAPGESISALAAYQAYVSWSRDNAQRERSQAAFGREMAKQFAREGGRIRAYRGCRLRDDLDEPLAPLAEPALIAVTEGQRTADAVAVLFAGWTSHHDAERIEAQKRRAWHVYIAMGMSGDLDPQASPPRVESVEAGDEWDTPHRALFEAA